MPKKESTPQAFAARPFTARPGACVVEEQSGEFWWCACGKSERQPYCDGSHRGGPVGPVIVRFDAARTVSWCRCKQTGSRPFCDTLHECTPGDASALVS